MKLIIATLFIGLSHIAFSQKRKTQDPYKEFGMTSINALVADQSYYTQAVVKYNVVNEVVSRFGKVRKVPIDSLEIGKQYRLLNKSVSDSANKTAYVMEVRMQGFFKKNTSLILDILKQTEVYENVNDSKKWMDEFSRFGFYESPISIRGISNKEFEDARKKNEDELAIYRMNLSSESLKYRTSPDSIAKYKFKTLPITDCEYEIPTDINNLKSGFQFNHYAFNSLNTSALQAFGIANASYDKNTSFVIIDYIQYLDCNCGTLPKIRYAVGIRAQLRIEDRKIDANLGNIPSLPKLAASVENENKKVDISVKTIGITGIPARYSIPSNTSFNVETYHNFQNVIDFIKSLEDTTSQAIVRQKGTKFRPEIMPILDDYKISLEESFDPIYKSMDEIERKIRKNKYKRWFLGKRGGLLEYKQPERKILFIRIPSSQKRFERVFRYNENVALLNESKEKRKQMLLNQLQFLMDRRSQEYESTKLLSNYSRFIALLTYLRGIKAE